MNTLVPFGQSLLPQLPTVSLTAVPGLPQTEQEEKPDPEKLFKSLQTGAAFDKWNRFTFAEKLALAYSYGPKNGDIEAFIDFMQNRYNINLKSSTGARIEERLRVGNEWTLGGGNPSKFPFVSFFYKKNKPRKIGTKQRKQKGKSKRTQKRR